MRFEPQAYQRYAIQRAIDQAACGLFLDMGLGKTVITLSAIVELMHERFEVARTLVIAPKRVAEETWTSEAAKWDHTSHLRIAKILGSREDRIRALNQSADIWVINRENVTWLVDHLGKSWPFDLVVIDELSSFKSSKSQRFRSLRKVRPRIKRILGLTGTPTPNGLIDLWPQVYLLDQGDRLGKTLSGYRDCYFQPGRRDPTRQIVFEWIPKPGAEKAIHDKLSDLCVSIRGDDWLQLPERIDRRVTVRLPQRAKEHYRQLERDLLLPLADSVVTADTAAALSNKLLQFPNGAVYDEAGAVHEVHDAKLDALEDLVEAANGKPLLVFYSYRHDRDRILRRFPQAVPLTGPSDTRRWNRGEIPILLAHPASAGHGLNLQEGGNHVVWFGITWSLELYQQGNARIHRQGQIQKVVVHHLIAKEMLDEDVISRLTQKRATQNSLLEALKARITKLREECVAT